MSIEDDRRESSRESTHANRRAEGATRIPFEALVEVGGSLGPSFEAQAIDMSQEGMHLRTAYLPEVGQPLTCRFDAGSESVLAAGEVLWKQEAEKGGEFGIRFTDLDPDSATAVARLMQPEAAQVAGARVRLHIDGLGSPMRARVKGGNRIELTVGSDLGFLQVGKQLELEDAETGRKRPAFIDRVEVEIDPESRVPQLVVALRYDATPAAPLREKESTPDPTVIDGAPASRRHHGEDVDADLDSILSASAQMKGAFARGVSRVGPAFATLAKRAKVTIALLAARRASSAVDGASPPRRTTSPPPGGGLHASGRKVVRGESMSDLKREADEALPGKMKVSKRTLAIAGAVSVAVLVGAIALRKPTTTPLASSPPIETPAVVGAPAPAPAPPANVSTPLAGAAPLAAPLAAPPAVASDEPLAENDSEGKHGHKKQTHVMPFTNGAVGHGNILRLKMDGPIEKIEGASQPTGFTVMIPNRKSLEAAGPLAARDGRIGSIKVTNDGSGAELAVTFKDGVPNYQVRAKADVLEIVLAQVGSFESAKPLAESAPTHVKRTDVASKKHRLGHAKR